MQEYGSNSATWPGVRGLAHLHKEGFFQTTLIFFLIVRVEVIIASIWTRSMSTTIRTTYQARLSLKSTGNQDLLCDGDNQAASVRP